MSTQYARSHWLDEALASENAEPSAALDTDIRADVCIVGGGYTGLWTAIRLKETEPAIDVVLIEKDLCASGASGRNAGFLLSLWAKFLSLEKICGTSEALRLAKASDDTVSEVIQFCADNNIDADIREDGWLWVATNAAQQGSWTETIDAIGRHGLTPIVEHSGEQAAARSGTTVHIGGAYESHAARVQPALLGRGLRRVAIERGVKIYEHTALESLAHGNPAVIKTTKGKVTAHRVVLAMNAWAIRWAEIRKSIVVVTGDMIVTPPIPDRLEKMGWTDGLTASDGRALVQYYRATRDGRLAYGKGGMSGTFSFGNKVGAEVEGTSPSCDVVLAAMHKTFPSLADVGMAKSWRGPIDRSKLGLPLFSNLGSAENVFYAVGFSGNGVGPCQMAGRVLASLALERQDEWSGCGLVRQATRDFPPEPFRLLGSKMIRRALMAKDQADDEGREPSLAARLGARLAPAGVSPFKAAKEESDDAAATATVVAAD